MSLFSGGKFLSYSTKNFVREPFKVLIISGFEKTYTSEGYVTIFHRNFFVSQYRSIS